MSFGRWIPLEEAVAPEGAGLVQARFGQGTDGLTSYPSGRSAMAWYDADDVELAFALERLRAKADVTLRARLWVRFAPPASGRKPSRSCAESLERFAARFGALPILNSE